MTTSITQKKLKTIIQSNMLTSARDDLTRDQRRIVVLFMNHLATTRTWPLGGELSIKAKEYAALFGVTQDEARNELRKATRSFRGKVISFYEDWDGERAETEIDWTTKRTIAPKRGEYKVIFNNELKPHLMPLAVNDDDDFIEFTILFLEDAAKLKMKYSPRLYAALMRFCDTGWHKVKVETLRDRWQTPSSYAKLNLLEDNAIKPAVDELKRFNQFKSLSWERVKDSNGKTTHFIFTFKPFITDLSQGLMPATEG